MLLQQEGPEKVLFYPTTLIRAAANFSRSHDRRKFSPNGAERKKLEQGQDAPQTRDSRLLNLTLATLRDNFRYYDGGAYLYFGFRLTRCAGCVGSGAFLWEAGERTSGRPRCPHCHGPGTFFPNLALLRATHGFWLRGMLRSLAAIVAGVPALVSAQYSEIKMGEYLHYAFAAANGGVYAGIDGIGYTGIGFGTPSLYKTNTGWVDLPCAQGFNTSLQIYGSTTAISHDGSVVAGSVTGTTTNGVSKQVAAYWVNGVESVVPAPPDDPGAITMSATAVSGDGTTLLVQDGTPYSATVETYVYNIASGTFTSLGFLGSTNHQTYATAINSNGTVVAGYSSLDNGNINGFIWNASNGVAVLAIPTNHPNTAYLEPTCMSDDGTTVFGRLTEFNGWVGFRYNTTNGYQDLGDLSPSACTADGTEAVGIENLYFPAVWSVGNGSGYLDHLVSANITPQALGTLSRSGHDFAGWNRHHGQRPGCLSGGSNLVWRLADLRALSAENGGDSTGHADLHDGLPDDLDRACRNADSICRIQHRRVRNPRQRAALCLRIRAERGRVIQLYAQTGLYQQWH